MTISTRGHHPLTSVFSEVRQAARERVLLTASTIAGCVVITGIFGVAVWAVASR